MKELYSALLMDHYHNPRHWGTLDGANVSTQLIHPSCGDQIQVMACIEDGFLRAVAFSGSGCILSQATASLLAECVVDTSISEIQKLNFEHMQQLIKKEIGPLRRQCITLALEALQQAIIKPAQ